RGTLLGDLAALRETEDLIAAAVSEDRPGPADERVQATAAGDQIGAGTEHQVIGVAEDDLRADLFEVSAAHRLDGALRPDRHEGRRRHDAVRGAKFPEPGVTVAGDKREGESVGHVSISTQS